MLILLCKSPSRILYKYTIHADKNEYYSRDPTVIALYIMYEESRKDDWKNISLHYIPEKFVPYYSIKFDEWGEKYIHIDMDKYRVDSVRSACERGASLEEIIACCNEEYHEDEDDFLQEIRLLPDVSSIVIDDSLPDRKPMKYLTQFRDAARRRNKST